MRRVVHALGVALIVLGAVRGEPPESRSPDSTEVPVPQGADFVPSETVEPGVAPSAELQGQAALQGDSDVAAPSAALQGQAALSGDVDAAETLLARCRAAEVAGDRAGALVLALRAKSTAPVPADVDRILRRLAAGLHREREGTRRRARRDYVRLAREREGRRRLEASSLARVCRDARRKARAGFPLEAFDLYAHALERSPGLPAARNGLKALGATLASRLRRKTYPSPAHRRAEEGVLASLRGEWEASARALTEVGDDGALPEELVRAHLAEHAASARHARDLEAWAAERRALLESAAAAEQAGRWEEASAACRAVLQRDPADSDARARLERLGAIEKGVEERVAEQAGEREVVERVTAGTRAYLDGRWEEALEEFARVLEIQPGHAEARAFIDEIRGDFERAGRSAPPIPVQNAAEQAYRQGLHRYGDGRITEAAESFREALRLDPRHDAAREALERLSKEEAKTSPP